MTTPVNASSPIDTALDAARAKALRIRLMVFDVDGVMSDGSLFYSDDGLEIKAFNSVDGLGLGLLRKAGVVLAVITGRKARCVDLRMQGVGIEHVVQGCKDKLTALNDLLDQLGFDLNEAGFMGDDVIDLQAMDACGFAAAPADAQPLAKRYADLVTTRDGGRGAVREVCEFILAAQGKLDAALAPFMPKGAQ